MSWFTRVFGGRQEERQSLALNEWASWFNYGGLAYPFVPSSTTLGEKQEEVSPDFAGVVQGAYKSNGIVFACILARLKLFSEARFQFRQLRSGTPGDLFGTAALAPLETPQAGKTTGDLLARAMQDADLAGNWYGRRIGDQVYRLRPDWVSIVLGSESEPDDPQGAVDAECLGYVYHPGGKYSGREPVVLFREEVAHFAPIPDPTASFRGMSWLTPVIREIMGDSAATTHKLKFFESGATPNLSISMDPAITPEQFERWIAIFESKNPALVDAYKTMYLGGGADVSVIGTNLKEADLKVTQGAGETRIAAAAGVPPIVVGLSEGLEAATYSNYGQARRAFADITMRPLWRNMCGSLQTIVPSPPGSELWYDDRDISFLQEDLKDAAEIQESHGRTIRLLVDSGFTPDSARDAVMAGDLRRLKHSGLVSVQLLPPGTQNDNAKPTPAQLEAGKRQLAGLLERGAN